MPISTRHRAGYLLGLVAVGVGAWALSRRDSGLTVAQLLAQAQSAMRLGQVEQAEAIARQALVRDPGSNLALLIAGKAAGKLGRVDEALALFERIQDDGSEESIEGLNLHGELLVHMGRYHAAEQKFRQSLARRSNFFAHHRLAHLMSVEGRYLDAAPHLLQLVRSGNFTKEELDLLCTGFRFVGQRKELEEQVQAAPGDIGAVLGLALRRLADKDHSQAEELLRQVLAADPRQPDAQAWLGWLLWHRADREGLDAWLANLTSEADRHPMTWVVRGHACNDHRQPREAIRCFWEALRLDPDQLAASSQLVALLEAEGSLAIAEPFRRRQEMLLRLLKAIDDDDLKREDPDLMLTVAEVLEALGRFWEAWGWCEWALQAAPDNQACRVRRDRLRGLLKNDLPVVAPEANVALQANLADYPLPNWNSPGERPDDRVPNRRASTVRFTDSAHSAGIDFVCYQGTKPGTVGRRFLEQTGGGVGVIDFDGDLWPDLYFTQGADWPMDSEQTEYLDKFYQNQGDGHFRDVTADAGLGDNRFSQGIAAGDFNNDGFPDLYLANLGENRLYRNNGDGTFSDVTAESGIRGNHWTTSCMIADLNGDGWPDLFDVNYVQRTIEMVFTRNGLPALIDARAFDAVQDVLWLSQGDGTFEDVSAQAGILAPNGNGLGIVAADFDYSGRLSYFVANDHAANFFFVNRTPERGAQPKFVESGLTTGLALNRDGLPQASMGVAADDADGDGFLDLFVTNFEDESNTLYLNVGQGKFFLDDTVAAGLREPSIPMVAWGTQFIDADLDGWPDLIVTNGHVDEVPGHPFLMRPQFFRNLGKARFAELPSESLGPFFQHEYRGAALARLDWNRDGREDVVISHIDQLAALLSNESVATGHFLAVQLRGVGSDRDAIGAVVHARVGDRTLVKQLVGGDGFHCTNQRQLVFGLGQADRIDELTVRWLSGTTQSFQDVPADAEFLLVEESSQLLRLPPPDR